MREGARLGEWVGVKTQAQSTLAPVSHVCVPLFIQVLLLLLADSYE